MGAHYLRMHNADWRFNQYDYVIISPKEKQKFLDHLLQIAPQIQTKVAGYNPHTELRQALGITQKA